jgi:transcriptional regulator with XRE-family HTH domain
MGFGDQLKKLRNERGLRQEDIGKAVHVGKSTVSQWESNIHVPDLETVTKIANYLNVSIDYLLGQTNDPRPVDDIKKAKEPDLDAPLRQKSLAEALYKISELIWEFDLDSETRRKLIDKAVAKFGPPPHMEKGGIAAHGPSVPGTGIFDKEDDDD